MKKSASPQKVKHLIMLLENSVYELVSNMSAKEALTVQLQSLREHAGHLEREVKRLSAPRKNGRFLVDRAIKTATDWGVQPMPSNMEAHKTAAQALREYVARLEAQVAAVKRDRPGKRTASAKNKRSPSPLPKELQRTEIWQL